MDKEPNWNLVQVCSDCMDQRKKDTQTQLVKLLKQARSHNPSMYVKTAFVDGEATEHMWIKVNELSFEERKIVGTLDNSPFLVSNFKYGDTIECSFDEIEEVL